MMSAPKVCSLGVSYENRTRAKRH